MRLTSSRRSTHITVLCLFVFGALVGFSLNLNNYFLSDDFAQIGKVLSRDFSVTWGQEYGGFFRPLFVWSYVVDSGLWGPHPFGYHLTNIIVHGLNSFLVFQVARTLVRQSDLAGETVIAIAAGALFLLHPSHTEAVSWISGRADLIATFFVLLSLLLYWDYLDSQRKSHLALSLASFTLALLAKESAICSPFLLLVLSWDRTKNRRQLWQTFAGFVAVLAGFVALRAYAIGTLIGGYGTSQHLNFSLGWLRDRLLEASIRSLLPALPNSWSTFLFKPLQSPIFYSIVLVSVGLIAAAIIFRHKTYDESQRKQQDRRLLKFGIAFLISLLPVISLRLSLYETLGERFLYLPTVFSVLIVAYLFVVVIRDPRMTLLVLAGVTCFYSISLYRTTNIWREASQLAFNIKNDLAASASSDHLVILNAPDNLRGVPIFHNGLPEALQYFPKQTPIRQIDILSFQDLRSVNDGIELNSEGDLITISSVETLDRFERINGTNCFEVNNTQPNALQVKRKCGSLIDIFVFSGGKMRKL